MLLQEEEEEVRQQGVSAIIPDICLIDAVHAVLFNYILLVISLCSFLRSYCLWKKIAFVIIIIIIKDNNNTKSLILLFLIVVVVSVVSVIIILVCR